MDKKMKQNLILIASGVILFAAVMNINYVITFFKDVMGLFLPLIIGFIMAFVLSVPMNGFEKLLRKIGSKLKKRLPKKIKINVKDKTISTISLLLTVFSILLVIYILGKVAVPQIVESVKSIGIMIKEKWPHWAKTLQKYNVDTAPITEWVKNLDFENLIKNVLSGAGTFINVVVGTAASTISIMGTIAIAVVIMFYVLLSKKELIRHGKKIVYAYLSKEKADKIVYVSKLSCDVFAKFLSGQCIEACVLGGMMFVGFWLFKLPYAGLIAMLTCVSAFIPYIGAFMSCAIGVVLTLIANPSQAIMCFIVYQVIQFIENQFIYPNVVGNSVGLSPLWTLIAVLVGGKLFGLLGMIFFIPIVAVLYILFRESVNKKLKNKNFT
ncbi:MAG: AI-2E family transporter [Agathobacter sp.]|nr:AI-2E family transporter [Agathobacter sp.]